MSYKAEEVYYNFRLYQHFLIDNSLDDDSDQITVENLMDYVKNQIPDEYKKENEELIKEMY